jgi:hypothetical protein
MTLDRSPEVLLGCPYTGAIDMWSLACVCAEMYLGLPLFPGVSQHNQLSRIVEMFGNPPDFMIECKNGSKYFTPIPIADNTQTQTISGTKMPFIGAPSSTKYRIKTPEEYAAETKTEVPILKKYLKYHVLDEVILKCFPAHKLRLTPEQKNIEINRRKCFVDFLYGLFRLNPFERWSAKQAMEHPFIKNTAFTAPFVPPPDPKLQDRKLAFMIQLQQRAVASTAASSTSNAGASLNIPINVDPNNDANIQGQRIPTNFGSSLSISQSTATKSQYNQERVSALPPESVDSVLPILSVDSVGSNKPPMQSSESSPLSPLKSLFDSDDRPTLKRGAPVHLKSASSSTTAPSENTSSNETASSTPQHADDMINQQLPPAVVAAAGMMDSKAPRPTGNIGRGHKPRHSFTTRVEQQMLKPQEMVPNQTSTSTSAGFFQGMQVANQQSPASISAQHNSHGASATSSSGMGSALTHQFMSQSLQVTSDLGQYIHDNRKQAYLQQSQHHQLFAQSSNHNNSPQHHQHHVASSWNPFQSSMSSINQKSGITALYSSAGSVGGNGAYQQTASPHHQTPSTSSWHPSHMIPNQQTTNQVAASAPYFNAATNAIPSMSYNPHQQQHFLPPPPGPEFYVGSIGGHLSSNYGGSLGVFAAGSMQEGGHAMTDFGMALLRPDMDEQRRLLSQQSVNSSSGYWPGHISSYMPFNNDQSSHGYQNPSQFGYNGPPMAMSYDSTTFFQHQQQMQQQQQQQQQAQQNMMSRQSSSMNYPPLQIRKDALASLSPRTSRKTGRFNMQSLIFIIDIHSFIFHLM